MRWIAVAAVLVGTLSWQGPARANTIFSFDAVVSPDSDSSNPFGWLAGQAFSGRFDLGDLILLSTPGDPDLAVYESAGGSWEATTPGGDHHDATGVGSVTFSHTSDPPASQFGQLSIDGGVIGSYLTSFYVAFTAYSGAALLSIPGLPADQSALDAYFGHQTSVYGAIAFTSSSNFYTINFSVSNFDVVTTPLPAAGLLFVTALAAIPLAGLMRRRSTR